MNKRDRRLLQEICAQAEIVRFGAPAFLEMALAEIRGFLETDKMMAYRVSEQRVGWRLDLFHSSGFPDAQRARDVVSEFFVKAPTDFALYDPSEPELSMRNRVIEATRRLSPAAYEVSPVINEVMAPLWVHRHLQVRALLCSGPTLLAWVGCFHPEPRFSRQRRLLQMLVPALGRRLAVERRLHSAHFNAVALEAALTHIGFPAFALDEKGNVQELNALGRNLLQRHGRDVRSDFVDICHGRASRRHWDVTQLHDMSTQRGFLVVLRDNSAEVHVTVCIADAADRWQATPRQRQVLEHVVHGMTNATIADTLGISERAVEQHVSRLFDRAGVECRAALVAHVLSIDSK